MANIEPKPDSQTPETPTGKSPKKSRARWALILPLALFAGAMWLSSREPNKPLAGMGMAGGAGNNTTESASNNTSSEPQKKPEKLSALTLYVPGPDAMLHRRQVDFPYNEFAHGDQGMYAAYATIALETLLQRSKEWFPTGTKTSLKGTKYAIVREGDVVSVNFNQDFAQPKFWQGELQTQLILYSVVNTLAAADTEDPEGVQVRLLIDGKPLTTLGEFDTSEPITRNERLVAKG